MLQSLKISQFPKDWSLLDVLDRYDDEIWIYLKFNRNE